MNYEIVVSITPWHYSSRKFDITTLRNPKKIDNPGENMMS